MASQTLLVQIPLVVLAVIRSASCMPEGAIRPSHSYLPPPPPPPPSQISPVRPKCSKVCPFLYMPVCGSDGITYTNECTFSVAACKNPKLILEGSGSCASKTGPPAPPPPPSPPQFIPDAPPLSAVPGSGVIPFPPEFGILDGPLEPFEPAQPFPPPAGGCNEACTKIFKPVCGTDGTTYNNECLLEVAVCKGSQTPGFQLSVSYEGICAPLDTNPALLDSVDIRGSSLAPSSGERDPCDEECTKIFDPHCGSNDVTYNNLCILEAASCQSVRAGGPQIEVVYEGHCVASLPSGPECNQACIKTFLPVCGSDGETYNNLCLLNLADCLNPLFSITHISDGPCDQPSQSSSEVTDNREQHSSSIPAAKTPVAPKIPSQGYLPPPPPV